MIGTEPATEPLWGSPHGGRRAKVLRWTLAVYWFALFLLTHVRVPQVDAIDEVPHSDKWAHLIAYAILALLVGLVVKTGPVTLGRCALAAFSIIIYAALDEWSQSLLAFRTADWWDWLADLCGAAMGLSILAATQLLGSVVRRRRSVMSNVDAAKPLDRLDETFSKRHGG